jgi:hypothetical protein
VAAALWDLFDHLPEPWDLHAEASMAPPTTASGLSPPRLPPSSSSTYASSPAV